MKLRLNMCDVNEIIIAHGGFNNLGQDDYIKQSNYEYNHSMMQGYFKELFLENIRIGYGNCTMGKQTILAFEMEEESVEMHFTLEGTSITSIEGLVKKIHLSKNEHNIFYGNNVKGQLQWESNSMFIFEVNIKPSFFKQLLPDEKLFEQFKKLIQNKKTGVINEANFPIQPHMHFIISEIINCNRKGFYKKMFLEAKVIELLILQLEQIQAYSSNLNFKISKKEIDKMQFGKDLILKNLKQPLSLLELSKKLNTNEFTLKKNFKIAFGTTVFGYIQDLKMHQAKELLLEQSKPVNEIADIIGYKNPQHFSTAFKNKFGVSPSLLKK